MLDAVGVDARMLLGLIPASADLEDFLADSLIHPKQKQRAFRTLLSGKVSPLTMDFLLFLCEKRRERTPQEALQGFLDLRDERRGFLKAQVRSAVPLRPEQQERLVARLQAHFGKKVSLEWEADEGVKAGFVARVGDTVFDATLDTQLSRLRRRLGVGPEAG